MKNSILTWVLTGFSISLVAQPDIQFINWGIYSDTYRVSTENVVPNPVPPGNNVVWDFSSLGGDISIPSFPKVLIVIHIKLNF